jgi:hypothetical protein
VKLEDHATVRRLSEQVKRGEDQQPPETMLNGAWLRRLALDCGADDAGLVEIARPALDPQREEILRNYPWTKSLLSFVLRMAREPVRGAPRSVANLELHRAGHQVNDDLRHDPCPFLCIISRYAVHLRVLHRLHWRFLRDEPRSIVPGADWHRRTRVRFDTGLVPPRSKEFISARHVVAGKLEAGGKIHGKDI